MKSSKLPPKSCNLEFTKTVTRWDEAIPLGNGLCGALIWGPSNQLRFSLDRGDLWDTTPFPGIRKKEFSYKTMVDLAKEGKEEEIRRIFDTPYHYPLPSKLPAGKLIFDFGCNENVISTLNLAQAEATISIGDIQIKSFLHASDKFGFIQINKPLNAFSFQIQNPMYSIKTEEEDLQSIIDSTKTGGLNLLAYKAPIVSKQGNVRWFIQEINESFSYGIFAQAKEIEGGTQIAYFVAASTDGTDWKNQALSLIDSAISEGYDKCFVSHCNWWKTYWSKSTLTVPDLLFEKNWYLTQYFLACCSRKGYYPMAIQGVWTADDDTLPPWKGDYHHDLNTEMCYYSYLKANHMEEGESFIDFLWSLADRGRKFAKSFYNSQGMCLPAVMSLTGDPLGGWGMYSLSPTNQLWLCQAFERHYRFSGDKEFLEKKAYPYLTETAVFILGLLEERNGLYYLPVSSSSELHDDSIKAFVTPNSNFDLSLIRYLFTALIWMSEELENGEAKKWKEILNKLPQLAVNKKNVLMISPDESLEESHRHLSHAMAIHPLRLLPYQGRENCKIIDATILDLERLGTGGWVGFSFPWMAELYAIQGNGNGAAHQLKTFWNHFCSQNGFHLNGDYKKCGVSSFHDRPFTLEANFGAADALQEMLLQTENGAIHLFPAIPEKWLSDIVAFEDLRAEKGLLISAIMKNGKVISLTFKPQYSQTVILRGENGLSELLLSSGMEVIEKPDGFELLLEAGKEYILVHNS